MKTTPETRFRRRKASDRIEPPKRTTPRTAAAGSPTSLYLNEISRYGNLERDEEQRLAALIQAGRAAADELDAAGGKLPPSDRRRVTKAIREGNDAREILINHNLRLVVSLAKGYAKPGLDLLDVIGEGNIGLLKAVDSFQPGHGTKFSTWGTLWIKQAISRGSHAVERAIRLPAQVIEDAHHAIRARSDLMQTLGRDPSLDEISTATGIPAHRVSDALELRHPSSLDAPIGEDGGATVSDLVADDARDTADVAAGNLAVDQLARTLDCLTEEEAAILRARLGLDGSGAASISDVADHLGISAERARNAELRAVAKLRHPRNRFLTATP